MVVFPAWVVHQQVWTSKALAESVYMACTLIKINLTFSLVGTIWEMNNLYVLPFEVVLGREKVVKL